MYVSVKKFRLAAVVMCAGISAFASEGVSGGNDMPAGVAAASNAVNVLIRPETKLPEVKRANIPQIPRGGNTVNLNNELSENQKIRKMAIERVRAENRGKAVESQAEYRERLSSFGKPLEDIQLAYSKAASAVDAREAAILEENSEIKELNSEIAELEKQISAAQKSLAEKNARIREIVETDSEYSVLMAEAKKIETERAALRGKVMGEISSNMRKRNNRFEEQVKKAEEEIRAEMEEKKNAAEEAADAPGPEQPKQKE